jgi:peptide/nickel transport system permease protein
MGHVLAWKVAARGAEAALSLTLLVTLAFFLAHAAPDGPEYAILGVRMSPARVHQVATRLGLAMPVWRLDYLWWAHVLRGSLGYSFLLNRPVTGLLADYAGNSAALLGVGFGCGLLLTVAGGLAHGAWYRRWPGRVLGGLELLFYALPGFVIGTFLALAFSGWLRWLPPGGIADLRLVAPGFGDFARHLVLPALTVALVVYAGLARFFAESVDAELGRPYARMAAAKGLSSAQILFRHVAPNAVRPLITLLGLSLPGLFAASVVVESVFSYPGLGWLLWRSALARDYPVLIGIVLIIGALAVIGNLLADVLNTMLDPRLLNA